MRSLLNISVRPYAAIVALCVALIVVLGVSWVSQVSAKSATEKTGQRLISIHEDGTTRGILTDEKTLRDAFKEANISVDPNDLVEPGLDHELVAGQYDVNIYRARPVTIVDGAVRTKIISAYQTASQIADHAKVDLNDEDTTEIAANTDMVREGVGLQVVVERATPFTLIMYGKKIDAFTQSTTVGDMLKSKNITLGKADTLSVSESTPITAGMTVELWRNGKQTITEEQEIAFPIEQIKDADREVGYKDIKTPGEKGKKTVSYDVEMKNGVEVSRKEIQSVTTKEPKKQVEVVGVKMSFNGGGSKEEWLRASGIPESQWGYVDFLVSRESGWKPCSYYPSRNDCSATPVNACGLVQQNPCHKIPGDWRDPVAALKWQYQYVQKFGGYAGAVEYWKNNGSY